MDRLKNCVQGNLVKLNKAKCTVLHLGQGHLKHKCRLGDQWLKTGLKEKDLVSVDGKLNMRQQCVLAAQMAD